MANRRLRDDPSDLPRLALSLTTLALVGFSLVLSCQMVWLNLAQRTDFAQRNTLGLAGRLSLLLSLGAGLALPAALGLALVARRRIEIATPTLERVARRLSPLAALFMLPPLFLSQVAHDKPLYYLIALSAVGLIFSALLNQAFSVGIGPRMSAFLARVQRRPLVQALLSPPRGAPLFLLLLLAALCAFLLVQQGLSKHRLIQDTPAYLAVPENVLANLRHGRFFQAPVLFGTATPGNYLTVHAEYGALLFAPLYGLRPGAETLIWLDAALAALSVIPLYLLAASKLGRAVAAWVGAVYLLTAPLHGALVTGFSWFHAVTLFSFTLYYAVESGRRWLMGLSLLLLLSISEVGPLNVFAYGLMLVAGRRKARLGLLLSVLAMPVIALNLWLLARGARSGQTPELTSAIVSIFRNPTYFVWDLARFRCVTVMLHALAPLCLLPLFELACWPLLLPGVLFTSATTLYWPDHAEGYVTSLIWLPACFLALVVVLEKRRALGRAPLVASALALTLTVVSHSYNYGALLRADGYGGLNPETVRRSTWGDQRYAALRKVLQPIPATARVAATSYLVSFVSSRPDACDLAVPCGRPDYLLLSNREVSSVRQQLTELFATRQYRLASTSFDEFYLFQRSPETPETRDALGRLGIAVP
ncbi:MAG TPA: DUF2079 domain-containing protein [Polyangiaceae bacterium]|nr:DUF2079 domain-containing protein [Polyangiaceae bacterium]